MDNGQRRILIIGMGMVSLLRKLVYDYLICPFKKTALSFIEKLFAYEDEEEVNPSRRYNITVVGEEPWVAYNRVGLVSRN